MLQQNLAGLNNEEEIAHLLKMDIIISPDTRHPDVAWVSPGQRRSVAGRG